MAGSRSGKARSPVWVGSIWMVVLSLALFFLPALNGVIAGVVGGYKVGSMKRALLAALLPAAVVALGMWVLLLVLDLPIVGLLAGVTAAVWILLSDLGLLVGAAIGGTAASARLGASLTR